MSGAVPIALGSPTPGEVAQGGADLYEIEPGTDGLLIAQTLASSSSLHLRLSLYDGQGNLLVQSDGQSSALPGPDIDQHVSAGSDFLEVQSLSGSGAYSLSTSFAPSSDPGETLELPPAFQQITYAPIAVGDFTNDGLLDIVAPDGVYLGTGDGTFEAPAAGNALVDPSLGQQPSAIAVGDFNGDGDLDVAMTLAGADSVSISLGNGNGSFQPATLIALPVGSAPGAIIAGDFLGNGLTDLAVADTGTNAVSILLNNGNGTFQVLSPIAVGQAPVSITEGVFEDHGRIDLAVADAGSGDVTILSNQGGGNFQVLAPIELPSFAIPTSITAANFGTGFVDLAVTDANASVVDILTGHGDGTFTLISSLPVGSNPSSIVAGDFGNGHVDLAVADANTNDLDVLMGNGDGTFQSAVVSGTGAGPFAIVTGDYNRDGRVDLATGNVVSNDISVLLGDGNGTFEESVANPVLGDAAAVSTGDFTGNGNLGLAVVNSDGGFQFGPDSVTILPGNGDGTFQQPVVVALPPGGEASSIVAADFNGDGRTDLAVAEPGLNEVAILLGNGDGTFEPPSPISVPGGPYALVAGYFTGNGRIDLAVADSFSSSVTILLGNGDGTFQTLPPITLPAFSFPNSIVEGNFTRDGHVDLAVGSAFFGTITVLLGNGDGTFRAMAPIALGGEPYAMSLAAGDFLNNGLTDLAVATTDFLYGNTLDVLLCNGDGTFQQPEAMPIGADPVALVVGDFRNNGILDLATADAFNAGTDDYSVYLGNGDGTFQTPISNGLDSTGSPTAIVTGDFTGNGGSDLAITLTGPDDVQVQLSAGDGTFSDPSVDNLVRRETPLLADINGDGTPDVTVVDAAGDILYRAGQPGEPGVYALPVTVNWGDPSRDITFVTTQFGPTIASVDAEDNAISFFVLRATGFMLVGKLATGSEPAQIVAADLDGDGITDLIVRNAGDGTISVFDGNGNGWFLPPVTLPVGPGASDVEVADLQQNGLLDIVYTNRISGEVGVLENLGGGSFGSPVLYRAGPGPYGATGTADPSPVSSLEGTTSVAAGVFTPGGLTSLVVLDPGSNTLGLLTGLGDDELSNPTYISTPASALVVRAFDLSGQSLSGLAVLTSDGLFIYVPNGRGGYLPPTQYNVGFEPNGLTVTDLTGNGKDDLLVSNSLGDVQVLMGNGDGTFQSAARVGDRPVELAAGPGENGSTVIIYADQQTDMLTVDDGGNITVLADESTGLDDPVAVTLADLNNDGILDLIVANSGSNNVLVYPGLGNGKFGPALNGGHGFFTGADPVGITVADLTGNGRLDLILANERSNDVVILMNVKVGNSFTFEQGQLLQAGLGPVSTAVVTDALGNVTGLLVTNSGSNNVWLLQRLGDGFFNDQSPIIVPVGTDPGPTFVGNFDGKPELVTVNAGSNDLTEISGFNGANPFTTTIPSGGVDPDTAFAFASSSGFEDLVVGNAGDGELVLFGGGPDGLTLTSAETEANLPEPTALAFSALTGGQVQFYAATAGGESPELVALSLGIETATTSQLGAQLQNTVAQLVPLNESSLPLVATVLTLTITASGGELNLVLAETEVLAVAAFLPGTGVSVGQGLSSQGRGGPGGDDDVESDESAAGVAGAVPAAIAPWERYVIGLDEALEQFWRENPNGVSGAPAGDAASDRPESPAAVGAPAQGGPTSLKWAPTLLPSGGEPDPTENASESLGVEAIDAIIQSVWGEDRAGDSRERLSHTGRPSERSHDVLPPVRPVISSFPRPLSPDRIVGEPRVSARSELALAGSDRRTCEVLPPGPETGINEPDLALTSLVVATMATKWVHARQWHRSVRPGWPGKVGNPVRRRRVVIK